MTRTRTAPLLALALLGAIALAGCGPATTNAPTTSAPTATTPAAASAPGATTGTVTGDCGEATAVLIKQHLAARTDIVSVTTQGGCHDALIETTLGPDDALKGRDICDLAAEVAYDGDISSITVLAADTTELSIGIKGQDCIAEL